MIASGIAYGKLLGKLVHAFDKSLENQANVLSKATAVYNRIINGIKLR